jgi:transposase
MQEKVTLNRKEQKRAMVINEMEKGKLRGKEAAVILEISLRQLRRMTAAYREVGVAALAHGNRGRGPVNRIKDEVRQVVIELARCKYAGFNQQHFTEFLQEAEGIAISRSSVRNILHDTGIRSPRRRRPPKHRSRRERYSQEGMLLQVDGSPHDWLEGRGSSMSLVGAIDDATGKVPYAVFREQEDSQGYFLLLAETIKRKGIPLALYHDRHSIFEIAADEIKRQSIPDQLSGKPMLTQFGRVMAELGITPISARSPQAEGRIERLWETFQDRLTSELRLAGISTLKDANQFLAGFVDRYNTQFAVPPEEEGSAYRPAQGLDLETVFCYKYDRVVGADNVVRFGGNRLQILPSPDRQSYARCPVQVHEQLDGNLKIYYQGSYLEVHKAPPEATKLRELVPVKLTHSPQPKIPVTQPAPDHPWRRWVYRNHSRTNSE